MSDVRVERRHAPDAVERVLRGLPDWLGIDEAICSYVEDAAHLRSYLAVRDGGVTGIALLKQHFPLCAEIHLLAVQQDAHRRGIGSALLSAMEDDLSTQGIRYLLVHTVGPSFDSPPHAVVKASSNSSARADAGIRRFTDFVAPAAPKKAIAPARRSAERPVIPSAVSGSRLAGDHPRAI